jgi:hypothetical protein
MLEEIIRQCLELARDIHFLQTIQAIVALLCQAASRIVSIYRTYVFRRYSAVDRIKSG